MTTIDLTLPSALSGVSYADLHGWRGKLAWDVYRSRLHEIRERYGEPSPAVLALLSLGTDALVAWYARRLDAPDAVLRSAAANFRAAKQLARKEAAQRKRLARRRGRR